MTLPDVVVGGTAERALAARENHAALLRVHRRRVEATLEFALRLDEQLAGLYRHFVDPETGETFSDQDAYCRRYFGFSVDRADQWIKFARVLKATLLNSSPTIVGELFSNVTESQARELLPLLEDPEGIVTVMGELREEYGKRITADLVRDAVARYLNKPRTTAELLVASNSNEWYTPAVYLDAARAVLGAIDLDPASCDQANGIVGATAYYTTEMDGLAQPWFGSVWLNPPYGRLAGAFVLRLIEEYETGQVVAGITLLNAHATDTDWFAGLWNYALCFTDHRINFVAPDGEGSGSTHGSVFVYLGPDDARFAEVFGAFGVVVKRYQP